MLWIKFHHTHHGKYLTESGTHHNNSIAHKWLIEFQTLWNSPEVVAFPSQGSQKSLEKQNKQKTKSVEDHLRSFFDFLIENESYTVKRPKAK